jgi:hypothetical protein
MKSALHPTILLATTIAVLAAAACASGGPHKNTCIAPAGDSVYRTALVAYRPCAVDREAKLSSTTVHPIFDPNIAGGPTCYSADYEFVVDPGGRIERNTVTLIKSNSRPFSDAIEQMIPSLVYEPAVKGGTPVRQIVSLKETAQVAKMVVPAGAPIRPPAARAPAC